jgi:hypothetical protein
MTIHQNVSRIALVFLISMSSSAIAGKQLVGPEKLGHADYDLREKTTGMPVADLLDGKAMGKTIMLEVEIDRDRSGERFINCFPAHSIKGEDSNTYVGLSCTDTEGDAFYVLFFDGWRNLTDDTNARKIWLEAKIVSRISDIPIVEAIQVSIMPGAPKSNSK